LTFQFPVHHSCCYRQSVTFSCTSHGFNWPPPLQLVCITRPCSSAYIQQPRRLRQQIPPQQWCPHKDGLTELRKEPQQYPSILETVNIHCVYHMSNLWGDGSRVALNLDLGTRPSEQSALYPSRFTASGRPTYPPIPTE
jgi:hypothetical protein